MTNSTVLALPIADRWTGFWRGEIGEWILTSGLQIALLLIGAMSAGFTGGLVLKGKSGWCSTVCPLLPVQRIYGQTPFVNLTMWKPVFWFVNQS